MKVGIDVGFGWTKYCTDNGQCGKFPTWIGHVPQADLLSVDSVVHDGVEYVVGKDAVLSKNKIIINSVDDLIKFFPVFKAFALKKLY